MWNMHILTGILIGKPVDFAQCNLFMYFRNVSSHRRGGGSLNKILQWLGWRSEKNSSWRQITNFQCQRRLGATVQVPGIANSRAAISKDKWFKLYPEPGSKWQITGIFDISWLTHIVGNHRLLLQGNHFKVVWVIFLNQNLMHVFLLNCTGFYEK